MEPLLYKHGYTNWRTLIYSWSTLTRTEASLAFWALPPFSSALGSGWPLHTMYFTYDYHWSLEDSHAVPEIAKHK